MALVDASVFLEAPAFLEATCFVACCLAANVAEVPSKVANAMAQSTENLEKVLVFMVF
jgi:hypothetical protein